MILAREVSDVIRIVVNFASAANTIIEATDRKSKPSDPGPPPPMLTLVDMSPAAAFPIGYETSAPHQPGLKCPRNAGRLRRAGLRIGLACDAEAKRGTL
jgi:hypothetical protein